MLRLSPMSLSLDLHLARRELAELGEEEGVLLDEGEELLELLWVSVSGFWVFWSAGGW